MDKIMASKGISLTAAAYADIRSDILACRLKPGEKLTISDISESRGISLGAVREALSRLTSEGLVIAEPRKGFRVAPITEAELEDITRVRTMIELQCLELAIEHGDLKWEANIVATLFELSKIPLQLPSDPLQMNPYWSETHKKFHEALVQACDSPWLLKLREILYAQSERYRSISVPLDRASRDINAEHKLIADAAIARDKKAARAAMSNHLSKTTRILIESDLTKQAMRLIKKMPA